MRRQRPDRNFPRCQHRHRHRPRHHLPTPLNQRGFFCAPFYGRRCRSAVKSARSPARSTSGFGNSRDAAADNQASLPSAPCDADDPVEVAGTLGPGWSPRAVCDARRASAAAGTGPLEPVLAPVPADNRPIRDADAAPGAVCQGCGSSAGPRPM